jgi:hypothetical protein
METSSPLDPSWSIRASRRAKSTSSSSRPFASLSSRPACTCPQAGPRSPRGTAQHHSCSWFVRYFAAQALYSTVPARTQQQTVLGALGVRKAFHSAFRVPTSAFVSTFHSSHAKRGRQAAHATQTQPPRALAKEGFFWVLFPIDAFLGVLSVKA